MSLGEHTDLGRFISAGRNFIHISILHYVYFDRVCENSPLHICIVLQALCLNFGSTPITVILGKLSKPLALSILICKTKIIL